MSANRCLTTVDRYRLVAKGNQNSTARTVPGGPLDVVLVDRSTRRMFRTACERFTARGTDVDPEDVPEYYRRHIGEIEGFFRLTHIAEISFDEPLAERLGEAGP